MRALDVGWKTCKHSIEVSFYEQRNERCSSSRDVRDGLKNGGVLTPRKIKTLGIWRGAERSLHKVTIGKIGKHEDTISTLLKQTFKLM